MGFCQLHVKVCGKVLINHLVKLAQDISVVKRTDLSDMTMAVDVDAKNRTKQTNVHSSTDKELKMALIWTSS